MEGVSSEPISESVVRPPNARSLLIKEANVLKIARASRMKNVDLKQKIESAKEALAAAKKKDAPRSGKKHTTSDRGRDGGDDRKRRFQLWETLPLVARAVKAVQLQRGGEAQVVAEIREHPHGAGLLLRVGRANPRVLDPTSGYPIPHTGGALWFEDVLAAVECIETVYTIAMPRYREAMVAEVQRRVDRERSRLHGLIQDSPGDWRQPLLEMREALAKTKEAILDIDTDVSLPAK